MSKTTVYTVEITAYPHSWEESETWEPEGWAERVEDLGWDRERGFIWPDTSKIYKSRSSAVARKRLIESYGAKAQILVGSIEWRSESEEKIAKLEAEIARIKESA